MVEADMVPMSNNRAPYLRALTSHWFDAVTSHTLYSLLAAPDWRPGLASPRIQVSDKTYLGIGIARLANGALLLALRCVSDLHVGRRCNKEMSCFEDKRFSLACPLKAHFCAVAEPT